MNHISRSVWVGVICASVAGVVPWSGCGFPGHQSNGALCKTDADCKPPYPVCSHEATSIALSGLCFEPAQVGPLYTSLGSATGQFAHDTPPGTSATVLTIPLVKQTLVYRDNDVAVSLSVHLPAGATGPPPSSIKFTPTLTTPDCPTVSGPSVTFLVDKAGNTSRQVVSLPQLPQCGPAPTDPQGPIRLPTGTIFSLTAEADTLIPAKTEVVMNAVQLKKTPLVCAVIDGAESLAPFCNPPANANGATCTTNDQCLSARCVANVCEAPSQLNIISTHNDPFTQGQNGATYTVTVTNQAVAAVARGAVTVNVESSPGQILASISGQGWSCTSNNNTCTRSDNLNAGDSYPPITVKVNVATNATSPQVIKVTVWGGGSPPASFTDSTKIIPAVCQPPNALCTSSTGSICVNTSTDPANCGSCGNVCMPPNATSACVSSTCAIGFCNPGFADCDKLASNGCETNITSSVANCGACGTVCIVPNATASCVSSKCAIGMCNAGFADCNNNPADGCEVNLTNSPANCGACGHACGLNQSCITGTCTTPTASCPTISAKVGSAISAQITVIGLPPPYAFSVIAGSLPPGATLDSTTGVVTGTGTAPSGPMTYGVNVVGADGNSTSCTGVSSETL